MIVTGYIVFNRRGLQKATHTRRPTVKPGECVVRVRLDVPDNVFLPEVATVDVKLNERDIVRPTISVVANDA